MRAAATLKFLLVAAAAVAGRPRLWPVAALQLRRFAPDGWWRRPPFLPIPPSGLTSFRAEAMYGDGASAPSSADLVTWLEWCRAQGRQR